MGGSALVIFGIDPGYEMCIRDRDKADELAHRLSDCDCIRFSDGFWYKFTKKNVTKENAIIKDVYKRQIPALQKGQYTASESYVTGGDMSYIRRYTSAEDGIRDARE